MPDINRASAVCGRSGTFYSPTAAAIAQNTAAAQNEAMIAGTIERGQANMAALEQNAASDETLTEKQAFADLLAWSASRPAWRRDALRRLVQNGKLDDKVST